MSRLLCTFCAAFWVLLAVGTPINAATGELETDLANRIVRVRTLLERYLATSDDSRSSSTVCAQLDPLSQELGALDLLLAERFRQRTQRLADADSQARTRHEKLVGLYHRIMPPLLESLQAVCMERRPDRERARQLVELLEKFSRRQSPPITGSLPYRSLPLLPLAPVSGPLVVPAYQQNNPTHNPADLAPSPEAPQSAELTDHLRLISAQAGKQYWDPVVIYEWVRNNIATEWYYGCMKGALETLRQGSGNDADQAALLIALLRAAGYPARYVRGVVEFFPDLTVARDFFGVADNQRIEEVLTRAGIPHSRVYAGAEIVNYRFEHIWVETRIPYANYRGALADRQGVIWLSLDTSLKPADDLDDARLDIHGQPDQPLANLRDRYLFADTSQSPLDYLRAVTEEWLAVMQPGMGFADLLPGRTPVTENLQILPAAPRFKEIVVTGEFVALPEDLIHKVRLTVPDHENEDAPLLDLTLPVYTVSNRRLLIDYEPESVTDHEMINQWAGLDQTPPYLVHLRPALKIDDQVLALGQAGFAYGAPLELNVSLLSPCGEFSFSNLLIAGYPQALGLVAQQTLPWFPETSDLTAVTKLSKAALAYVEKWTLAEQDLADLLGVVLIRPVPTLVTMGGQLAVSELFETPVAVQWRGLFVDADFRSVATVQRSGPDDGRERTFLQLSALQGSWLEGNLFAEQFLVEGASTVHLFKQILSSGATLQQVDQVNLDSLLSRLAVPENIEADIRSSVATGFVVTIPETQATMNAWSGWGYIKENPLTGEAGYMLSGITAGGYTILGRDDWPDAQLALFEQPHSIEPNPDVNAAHSIREILPWSVRLSTAGEETSSPLVIQVLDPEGVPVIGAPVDFRVVSGGGLLLNDTADVAFETSQLIAQTDRSGLARARFIPGTSTMANPVAYVRPGDDHANIVGQNLVAAQLVTGSLASLEQPMAILGFAGAPDQAQMQVYGDGLSGNLLSYVGNATVFLSDTFGNPVANHPVHFSVQPHQLDSELTCPFSMSFDPLRQDAQIIPHTALCLGDLPVYGECADAGSDHTLSSKSDGSAFVGILLGSVAGAAYPIQINAVAGTETLSKTVHATTRRDACPGSEQPLRELVIDYLRREDGFGHNVDARPAGRTATVRVKSYLLNEGQEVVENGVSLSCGDLLPKLCDQVVGSGSIEIVGVDHVQIGGVESAAVEHLPGSLVRAHLYESGLDLTAELHNLPVSSETRVPLLTAEHSCSACSINSIAETPVGPVSETVQLWGVRIDTPQAWAVSVDERGMTSRNADFVYTIEPAGYIANQAQVLLYADNQLWGVFPAAKSGTGSITLPTGYYFDPRRNYHVEVRLNNPGDVNDISSGRIPVMPRTSVAGLAIDGLPMDALTTVGAFVLINNDFDEQDRDASVVAPDAETPGMISDDDELRRGWLHTGGAEMVGGSWHLQVSDPARFRVYYDEGEGPEEVLAESSPREISAEGQVIPLFLEGLAESSALQEDSLVATFVSGSGEVITEQIPVTVLDFDLAVDGNRDRMIETSKIYDEMITLWINNDHDEAKYSNSGEVISEDDIYNGDDSKDTTISCKRDLEDFARLHLFFGTNLNPGDFTYSMQIVGEEDQVWPMLNLFPAVSANDAYLGLPDAVDADGTEPDRQLEQELLAVVGAVPVTIASSQIQGNGQTPFLFEGRKDGRGRLRVSLLYLGVPVLHKEVGLDLWDISYFYDSFVLGESGDSAHPVKAQINPFGPNLSDSRLGGYEGATDEYVLYVHGWNMEPWKKKRSAETVFKRLWWQGYQGKVGLFDWPCRTMPSGDFLTNFDKSEYLAWHSGQALSSVLEYLAFDEEKSIRLLAHSQGNVVAAEAIRLASAGTVHTYVASQAALSASMFESNLSSISPVLEPFTYETPDVYGNYPGRTSGTPYFEGVADRLTAMLSYYNQDDYTLVATHLASPCWEINNRAKPDDLLRYGYEGGVDAYAPTSSTVGFYQWLSFNQDDQWVDWKRALSFIDHDYEIYAFGAESRSRALGAVNPVSGFYFATSETDNKGSRDLALFGFDWQLYSHSRQFRSNVVDEGPYWSAFVNDCELHRTW